MKVCRIQKEETPLQDRVHISDLHSIALFVALAFLACIIIDISHCLEGWKQNLFLGLGTGAATSALVSLVFFLNDKLIKKRERLNSRIQFMINFKILLYNIARSINFGHSRSTTMDYESYVKNQHRWYHEYYKKMVAQNATTHETKIRAKRLKQFLVDNSVMFQQCFEYNSFWTSGEFSDWQRKELSDLYLDFKKTQIYLDRRNYAQAYLIFAFLLETVMRIPSEFIELNSFQLLTFSYNKKGEQSINTMRFEEKEPDYKFTREFNEIRRNNYKAHYAKVETSKACADSQQAN